MAANKRRKLNPLVEPKNISAFAARKQLQVPEDVCESGSKTRSRVHKSRIIPEEGRFSSGGLILSSSVPTQIFEGGIGKEFDHHDADDRAEAREIWDSDEDDDELMEISSKISCETGHLHATDLSWTHLTTAKLSDGNVEQFKDGTILVRIGSGEKLVILGDYGLSVIKGQITILGAILSTSQTVHEVCASSSHSLPVIRFFCSDTEKAEILLHQSHSRLRSLRQLSPLFAGIWSTSSSHEKPYDKSEPKFMRSKSSSFQILPHREVNPHLGYHPTFASPQWNQMLSKSASERLKDGKALSTMICGPKSSGKSTFSRLLINRLLTVSQARGTSSSVAFLDLDPGQPEFSPPGQLSLNLVSNPNFGPPFSHPNGLKNCTRLIRAHSISAVSPSSDPDFYMSCVTNLLSCYFNMVTAVQHPLIINTPGWILGTGLELLSRMIKEARPTQVIYMSQDGPREVLETLQAAAKPTLVLALPSQPVENLPRTSAHLRTMQYMSYFHLDHKNPENHTWNLNPITSMAPLEVSYSGKAAGILGIMCLGEQPPSRVLRDKIDGSLVAVVVLEDVAAILSSNGREKMDRNPLGQYGKETSMIMENCNSENAKSQFTEPTDQQLESSLIYHTAEGIPYFIPAKASSLDPNCSCTIGLAMVRGVDVRQRRLQLLTPISTKIIQDIRASGKAIILVSGKLDTPGWAYLETLYKKDAEVEEKNPQESDELTQDYVAREVEDAGADGHQDCKEGFKNAPWVEALRGDKGREIAGRIWRVRRDLGRSGGGY